MKISKNEDGLGRLDADRESPAVSSRSLAAWGTRRARALRIGVFDKRESQYGTRSIDGGIVGEARYSRGDDAGYPGRILEAHLADIENLALPLLTKWCQDPRRAVPSDTELVVLSAYLAIVRARLPTISTQLRAFEAVFAEGGRTSSGEPLRVLASARIDFGSDSRDPIGAIRRAIGEDDVRIEMRPKEAAGLSLHVPEVAFGAFRAMNWRFVEAPEGSEFITSDTPVNVFVPDGPSVVLDEGLVSPNAEVTFPVGPRVCLIGRRAGARGGVCPAGVWEVNQRQLRAAERFVYFRERTGAVERLMGSIERPARLDAGHGLTHVGEFGVLLIRGVCPDLRRPTSD